MKLRKIKPFFVLKNKKTGEIYKDVRIAPEYGFLVMNDNDAMTEIADIGDNKDWEWYISETDMDKRALSMKEVRFGDDDDLATSEPLVMGNIHEGIQK